jgi:hypothetical protein
MTVRVLATLRIADIRGRREKPMFLRWLSRARQSPANERGWQRRQDVHWRAILVEAFRVKGNPHEKPRQRVMYLAGITESAVAARDERALRLFWDKVETRFAGLGRRLSVADRQRIESALARQGAAPPRATARERPKTQGGTAACRGNLQ